ncbi:hypothetical protein ACFC09_36610 [Streptomyces sp. NPDC056161]|uniref:hypothetical protein n=1 Tax=Streptomyces sp. NPDC056161 TaxID=3345732 RepID=UPI0035E31BF8
MSHEDFERAASSLSSSTVHTRGEPIRELVRIAREDVVHRQQALATLDDFVTSQRGRPGYRSEPVLRARTALYALDPKRTVRARAGLEGAMALLLATASTTAYVLTESTLFRFLVAVAVWVLLMLPVSIIRNLWQPYVGSWVVLSKQTRWARGTAVVIFGWLFTNVVTTAATSLTEALLWGACACAVGWALWQPPTSRRS